MVEKMSFVDTAKTLLQDIKKDFYYKLGDNAKIMLNKLLELDKSSIYEDEYQLKEINKARIYEKN